MKNSAGGKDAGRAYIFRTSELGVIVAPTIDVFEITMSTIERGDMLVLDATLSGGTASTVEFFVDLDRSGDIDPGSDLLLAVDAEPSDGWSVTFDSQSLPSGSWDALARARSSEAAASWSDTVAVPFTLFEVCNGDFTGDRVVDGADLAVVLMAIEAGGAFPELDVTGDGVVTGQELSVVLATWGACP